MSRPSLANPVRYMVERRPPGQLVIQLTDRCNASCPQCGMNASHRYRRLQLSVDEVKEIIERAACNGVEALSFTGGEPLLLLDQVVELSRHARQCGIEYIRTGTNGFLFRDDRNGRIERIAEKLASTPIRNLWISIDSCRVETHESLRELKGVIGGIEKAVRVLRDFGLYPSANLGIHRQIDGDRTARLGLDPIDRSGDRTAEFYAGYREAFGKLYRFVERLGFTIVNTCYPMSVGNDASDGLSATYAATSTSEIIRFSHREKRLLYQALFDLIPRYRSRLRIFSPRISLYALMNQLDGRKPEPYGCRGGKEFFFIDARSGDTYPCGYRGEENLGKYSRMKHKATDDGRRCTRCDWECFRDASELFGFIMEAVSRPASFLRKVWEDGDYARLWLDDIRYYAACDFFDGRRDIDRRRLQRYASTRAEGMVRGPSVVDDRTATVAGFR